MSPTDIEVKASDPRSLCRYCKCSAETKKWFCKLLPYFFCILGLFIVIGFLVALAIDDLPLYGTIN